MDWMKQPDSFHQHLDNPWIGGSFEDYTSTNHLMLGREIASRRRIYLDTKYWVRFRDASQGHAKCKEDSALLDLIIDLCDAKIAVCPCSYSSIEELLYQDDQKSRQATAQLMDRLSSGACLQPPHILFAIELDYWLHQNLLPQIALHDRLIMVWTKAFYFVGQPRLKCSILTPEQTMAAEKTIFDAMWGATLIQLSDVWGVGSTNKKAKREEVANELTEGKFKHHDEMKSFNDLYADEVWGGLEPHQNEIKAVFERIMIKTGYRGKPSEIEIAEGDYLLRKMITMACRHGKLSVELPQCYIGASLHAAQRIDAKRRYKTGDCEDFRHAGSALPYCDLFLTEQSLCHLMRTPPLHLDKDYNVIVVANPDEAIEAVQRIAA